MKTETVTRAKTPAKEARAKAMPRSTPASLPQSVPSPVTPKSAFKGESLKKRGTRKGAATKDASRERSPRAALTTPVPPVFSATTPELASDDGLAEISPPSVFICSSEDDDRELTTLLTHLAPMHREAVISHLRNIPIGSHQQALQSKRIHTADVAIVIISAGLLASDRCQTELRAIFARSRRNQLTIVPVLTKACDLSASQLADLAILPRHGKPIAASENPAQLWSDVAHEVRRRVQTVHARPPSSPGDRVRSTLLIVDGSTIPDFGPALAANLAAHYLVTIRHDVEDGSHKTHDFTVLCIAPLAFPMNVAKTAMQLSAAEEERSEGRIVVVVPTTADDAFQEIPQLNTLTYDETAIERGAQAKLREIRRCSIAIERILASVQRKRSIVAVENAHSPTEMIQSMRRLNAVIVDLRDVLIQLPGKIGESLKDPTQIAATKSSIADDVRRIAQPFYVDAKNCGASKEYERLVRETIVVIMNLPHYYDPLFEGQSWTEIVESIIALVINAQADPAEGATKRALEGEIDRRLTNTVAAYIAWWKDGQRRLREATNRLLDAIQQASFSLSERLEKRHSHRQELGE